MEMMNVLIRSDANVGGVASEESDEIRNVVDRTNGVCKKYMTAALQFNWTPKVLTISWKGMLERYCKEH